MGALLALGISLSLKGAAGQMGPTKPAMIVLSPTECRDVWLSPVCLCRTASYYWDLQRQHYRSLLKLYGIRFDISVHGQVACSLVLPAALLLQPHSSPVGSSQPSLCSLPSLLHPLFSSGWEIRYNSCCCQLRHRHRVLWNREY